MTCMPRVLVASPEAKPAKPETDVVPDMLSPRSGRKPGLQTFTDPMNPFARTTSKAITNLQEARADPQRAGARTRTPGMIPMNEGANSNRLRFAVYQYGNHDYKPQKRCPDAVSGCPTPAPSPRNVPSPRSSPGATEALRMASKATTALENYLNDMKRCRTSLRSIPGTPSARLQRKNDENSFLPSERRTDADGAPTPRRSRSLSVEPGLYEEGRASDPYGFSRKRHVLGAPNHSSRDLLYHLADDRKEAQTPRTPRTTPSLQEDRRFQEVVAYIKETKPEMSRCLSAYKARNYDSTGLLYSSSPVLV